MAVPGLLQNPTDVSHEAIERALRGDRVDWAGTIFKLVLALCLAISLAVLAVLIGSQVAEGSGTLTERFGSFMTGTLQSIPTKAGIYQGLRGTFWIAAITAVLAFPLGVAAAVYLEEYAPRNALTRFIDLNIRNLAGVPSIVYGILGFTIFVRGLGSLTGGRSVISGGLTLAILVLPIVIITSAEAVRAVPDSLREAGYGVGATRWEVVRSQVLPYAAPGILTGTVLSLARALGEAAPLILVGAVTNRLGSNPAILDISSLQDRFTAMPMVITTWAGMPQEAFRANTAAAILVLLVIVLLFNTAAVLLRNRYEKKRGST
jgi:phosphate transport system permease protein